MPASPQKVVSGPRLSIDRDAVFRLLKELAADNLAFFHAIGRKSPYYQRIADCCAEVEKTSGMIGDLLVPIKEAAKKADFDEKTPGNGFRSLVCLCDQVVLHLISVLKECSDTRSGLLFRSTTVCKELENYAAMIRFFVLSFQQVVLLTDSLEENSLFPKLAGDYTKYQGLLKGIESLDASCFYGRSFGFQFTPTVTYIFNVIGIVLATYSLSWGGSAALASLVNSGLYIMNPEERAKQIIKVTREADIEFCRDFWNLSELLDAKLFCPPVEINEATHVPITTGREGLTSGRTKKPLSSNLLIHCHGGAYVATSSKSHEAYLRMWAKYLDCPIVSVDYSLSPDFPFPRPTEEVLYVYAWILKNAGELRRLPDGLIPIYTPFLFQYLPSPSRILSFADPLLHMGIVIRCAAAYTNVCPNGTEAEINRRKSLPNHGRDHKSLSEYVDEVKATQLPNRSLGRKEMLSFLKEEEKAGRPASPITQAIAAQATEEEAKSGENATVFVESDLSLISLLGLQLRPLADRLPEGPPADRRLDERRDLFGLRGRVRSRRDDAAGHSAAPLQLQHPGARKISVSGDEPCEILANTPSLRKSVMSSVTSSVGHAFDNLVHFIETPTKPIGHADKLKISRAADFGFRKAARAEQEAAMNHESSLGELLKLNLPRNPLISPMYASDEMLRRLPPCRFIALHMDPLLDDSVTFAKKMRKAGGRVRNFDVLHGLPHGFLNFTPMSEDCYEGARICVQRIKEAFESP
ncbi:hypothetical protein M3Y99_01656000 [Aphelenchoides fujianensis]|nr:hypothetical protein M3Y99_01656000 [Aphelenchoides fujianensis]